MNDEVTIRARIKHGGYYPAEDAADLAALLDARAALLARVAKLEAAAQKIAENELNGHGDCRYCGSAAYPVDEAGARITTENVEHAEEWHVDHDPECPSALISSALV